MSDYDVLEIGGLDQWKDYAGGRAPGKRFIDAELPEQYIGMSANALAPGGESPFWHSHSQLEELYVFLAGQGQMAIGNDVVDVHAGTVVRVGQNVMRAWRALPDSTEDLRWLCIRAGGGPLAEVGKDGERDGDRPFPWAS
ncbi:cupin domain-containing protein [Microbacterium gorillae]|uniref:cupin domain-containing protein n=1 Tax=Microbacterium gorillae TaxID=1231063 RepID=UPI000590D385|nr:cupin domain-containing protein [Microbacterium gorillae]